MAMNIDKMMTGINKEFVDKRGKRLFIGDMIAFSCYNDIKISQIIKFCDKLIITKYSRIYPNTCIKVNALFDEDELKQLNDKLVEDQKKEAEAKKVKVKKFPLVTFWKKGKDIGFTAMMIKSKPGSTIFTKKNIEATIKKYEAKYPEYTFIYLNKDNTFTPYINYKNLKLTYTRDSIGFYDNCWNFFEFTDKNDQLFFFKYEEKVDEHELAYTEKYYGKFGANGNGFLTCVPNDYDLNDLDLINSLFCNWNFTYKSVEEFHNIWYKDKKMFKKGILSMNYKTNITDIFNIVKNIFDKL